MKVRFLKTVIITGGRASAGNELDLPEEVALSLIEAGCATGVGEKKTNLMAESRENRKHLKGR